MSITDAQANTNELSIPNTNISSPQVIYARVTENATGNYGTTNFNLNVVTAPQPYPFTNPLTYCDVDNDGFGVLDLNSIIPSITGNLAGVDVCFYETEEEANQGVRAIDTSVLYENIDTDGDGVGIIQTIYAVLSLSGLECTTIVDVNLLVQNSPELPSNSIVYTICYSNNDGFAVFDLPLFEQTHLYTEIIAAGGNTVGYTASYYAGITATGEPVSAVLIPIPTTFPNIITPDQVIPIIFYS